MIPFDNRDARANIGDIEEHQLVDVADDRITGLTFTFVRLGRPSPALTEGRQTAAETFIDDFRYFLIG